MKNTLLLNQILISHSVYKLTNYKEAINKADIIVFLVAHKEFINITINKSKKILDFCGISNF